MKGCKSVGAVTRLLPFYICFYATNSIHNVFFSLYLYDSGLSAARVGAVLALAPMAAVLGQPVWSALGDKARYKRDVITALAMGAVVMMAAMALLPGGGPLWLTALVYSAFSFFYLPLQPMADTIALESLAAERRPFGPVRMSGTIAFSLLSYVSGTLINGRTGYVPAIVAAMTAVALAAGRFMPAVAGHRKARGAVSMRSALRCGQLMMMIIFSGLMMTGMSLYYGYFSIFASTELGATTGDIGLSFLLSSAPEVIFLIFSDRIYNRLGIGNLLLISAGIMTVRWALMFFVNSMTAVFALQLMHVGCFLPMTFAMSKFVNAIMPDSHKAAGQMLYTLVALNLARIIANFAGGFIAQSIGSRGLFLCASALTAAAIAVFGPYVRRNRLTLRKASLGELVMGGDGALAPPD